MLVAKLHEGLNAYILNGLLQFLSLGVRMFAFLFKTNLSPFLSSIVFHASGGSLFDGLQVPSA